MTQKRRDWTNLRYEYYISARRLFFDGLFSSGLLMFSYAIETSLKALASEIKDNEFNKSFKSVRNSHDILLLNNFFKEHKIEFKVSDDFLKFVTWNFNRYPTQIKEARNKWSKEIGTMTVDVQDICYFDSLITQINKVIYNITDDIRTNLVYRALYNFSTIEGSIFFHHNVHAKNYCEEIINFHRETDISKFDIINAQIRDEDILSYKEFEYVLPLGLISEDELRKRTLAENFKFQSLKKSKK